MPRLVAFLRALNVGGNHTVSMAELRRIFEAAGAADVETFQAAGNVIFGWRGGSAAGAEARIEKQLAAALGYEVTTFVRSAAEVAAIAPRQPFGEATAGLAAVNVGFLKQVLSAAQWQRLEAFASEVDRFAVAGREVWWGCRVRQSQSKFSNSVFERKVGARTTFRGVNTIVRLAAKLGG